MTKQAQNALENITIYPMIVIFAFILAYFAMDYLQSGYRETQIEGSLQNLVLTGSTVHSLGKDNKETTTITLPGSAKTNVGGRELSVEINGKNISMPTEYDVVGSIPVLEDSQAIEVKAINATLVKIGKWFYVYAILPNSIKFVDMPLDVDVYGEDFLPGDEVFMNDEPYPPNLVTYIDDTRIQFRAMPDQGVFNVPPNKITAYNLFLRHLNGTNSASFPFYVLGPGYHP